MPQATDVDAVLRRRTSFVLRARNETYAALALAAATIVALAWANIGDTYTQLWSMPAGVHIGDVAFDLTLSEWVDEGLMTFFFFTVGLDVRRELALGELRHPGRALLPVAAAAGGLILPAVIFLVLSSGEDYASAWGSVISTDTAFAIGMLALIGPRNAPRLRVFLLTLAVVDDIGALSVIAIFYTRGLDLLALALAALGLVGVWLLQRLGVWRVAPYGILGVLTWLALFQSGVHATLAGVLIALLMPVYPPRRQDVESASVFFRLFHQAPAPETARTVRNALVHAMPLNQRLSARLRPFVNYIVVPLFALANAGVALSGESLGSVFGSPLVWSVVAGLVIGKFVGIGVAAALVLRLVPSSRLPGLDMPRVAGAAALSGMGFTISLLVVGIAIDDPDAQDQARIGVLAASALALVVAWIVFRLGDRLSPLPTPAGEVLQRSIDPARDHLRGPVDAPATLVVYAAMDDEYRRRTADALTGVRRRMGDDLRIVYRHHTETDAAMRSALALEAAAAQGRFWEMHDAMVAATGPSDDIDVIEVARQAGLDATALADRVDRAQDVSNVDDDNLDARAAGLPETPVVYAQNRRLTVPANSWHLADVLADDVPGDRAR